MGTQRPGDKHYATLDAVRQDYPDYSQANQALEVLGRMAETDVRPYFMERVTAYIRRFLRSLGIRAPLSVAEIKTMIVDSAKQLRRSSGNQSVNGALSAAESLRVAEARSGLLQEAQPVRRAQTYDQARGEAKQFQGKALVNRQMRSEEHTSELQS